MDLSRTQLRHLRRLAHDLNPVVMVGQGGITPGLLRELQLTLKHHELIKVKVRPGDRQEREQCIATLCSEADCVLVQRAGNVVTLYRARKKNPGIKLPA